MRTKLVIACMLALIAAASQPTGATNEGDQKIQITVVSGRPDMVSRRRRAHPH